MNCADDYSPLAVQLASRKRIHAIPQEMEGLANLADDVRYREEI